MSSDEDEATSYNDTHRAFLQALLARQTITYESSKPLLAAIQTAQRPERPTLAHDITHDDFEEYLHTLHNALSPFDLEIRSLENQTTRERVYALVNSTGDGLAQMATPFTADEMAFVKRVLDAVFDASVTLRAEVFAVRSMEALRLARPPRSGSGDEETQTLGGKAAALTMAEAERVLECLVGQGWLVKSPNGFYSPTERLLMELNRWLRDTYNDDEDEEEDDDDDDGEEPRRRKIKDCEACRSIITIGKRCPNLPCEVRLHNHCVERFFYRGRDRMCPTCKTDWSDPLPVGEKAARNGSAGGTRRSTNGHGRSSGINGRVEEDSDASAGAE